MQNLEAHLLKWWDASPYQIGTYFGQSYGFPFGAIGGYRRDLDIGNFNLKPKLPRKMKSDWKLVYSIT